jgi:hypothetical protein
MYWSSPCSCLIKILSTVSIIFCNLSSDTKFCKYSCVFSLHYFLAWLRSDLSFSSAVNAHDDSNIRRKQTPWFNNKCRTSRKAFHEARKTYNIYKTNVTRNNMNLASREYKKELNQAYVKFQSRLSGHVRVW